MAVKRRKIFRVIGIIVLLGVILFYGGRAILFGGLKGPKPKGTFENVIYKKETIETDYGIDEDVELQVFLPKGYKKGQKYPLVFLLDGDSLFKGAAGYLTQLIDDNPGKQAILIGLGYGYYNSYLADFGKGRWRDYTFKEDAQFKEVANGPNFYRFLEEKVVPEMHERYSKGTWDNTLIGHSCGGDFTFHAFLQYDAQKKEANPFRNFIVGDGGEESHFKKLGMPKFEERLARNGEVTYGNITLYRVYGYLVDTENISKIENLHQWAANLEMDNLRAYRYYPLDEDHAATMKTTIVNGLKIALQDDTFKNYDDQNSHRF